MNALFPKDPLNPKPEGDPAKCTAYLEQLRRIIPAEPAFEAWLAETGELPPDFDALPPIPHLDDLLVREPDGRGQPITSAREWQTRRAELNALCHTWLIGRVPPPPDNLTAEIEDERREAGAVSRRLVLSFGPRRRAQLHVELLIPDGAGPFPVFMTQDNHRPWALIALRRGYVGCVYAGADSRDDTPSFIEAYPDCDWSKITRRAWAASRCLDYLETVPQADAERVAITGHSRNGKLSLVASALDERFAAVISSSSGTGGAMPAKSCTEHYFGEGPELLTRVFPDWFHPRLRFFSGRENRLPVDQHALVALSAPRPCLLSIALNDGVEASWAMTQTYLAVQKVYTLLNAGDRLRILWRPGGHETWTTVIERYLDWCDTFFRGATHAFEERLIHPCDWSGWQARNKDVAPPAVAEDLLTCNDGTPVRDAGTWQGKREEILEAMAWMLGETPPAAAGPSGRYGVEAASVTQTLRPQSTAGVSKAQVAFGEYIAGDVYMPEGLEESGPKAPAILWLHPFSYPRGYVAAYARDRQQQPYLTFARAGFAVFCFDQIGFGRRIEEVEHFYARHPRWSLLGKMVGDTRAAIDVIAALPYVDPDQICIVGYSLGAMVGLHAAAQDARVSGMVAVCGPQPFRLDTPDKGTGGIRRWSHLHMLMPRMGLFAGQQHRIPYDVQHLYAAMAPRDLVVVSPQLDWEACEDDITTAVKRARRVFALLSAEQRLQQLSPEDYNNFAPPMQELVLDALAAASVKPIATTTVAPP
ncbi:MAG: alpha/beta fold hydrolase [Kiritimatiellae bacterium]|nr:alpha/beta fold hydrolase [Kiritimatiellia bacterium]